MKLDTRHPLFVFLGAWNPAIFQPPWIAKYLFEKPEGNQIAAKQLTVFAPFPKQITYIDNIGVSASNERVEIYTNGFENDLCLEAEKVAIRLIKTLPHTPFGRYGINFNFVVELPNDTMLDALKTSDKVDQYHKIISQNITSKIEMEDDVKLNFSRQPSEKDVTFNFNYDHNPIEVETAEEVLTNSVESKLNSSTLILEQLYSLRGFEIIEHVEKDGE